ncbi:uncharacterized protein LOC143183217 [Calliopsis andreniformis]|uniref:uncharacterized protein LOC143183217 n=1 Tax=Calliopsis andreniformis TaxID=337506 RepID=UPI003FCC5A54
MESGNREGRRCLWLDENNQEEACLGKNIAYPQRTRTKRQGRKNSGVEVRGRSRLAARNKERGKNRSCDEGKDPLKEGGQGSLRAKDATKARLLAKKETEP